MKKWTILLVCVLLVCCISPALANSWGLKGELLELVSSTNVWNDYTSEGKVSNTAAVMGSRYHNVLMVANNGKLETYTKAVWQPDDQMPAPTVTANENSFSLRYSDEMWFTFVKAEDGYRLHLARVNGMSIREGSDAYRYIFTHDDGPSAILNRPYALKDFNISLFPQSINEVRHLNWIAAALDSDSFIAYTLETLVESPGEGTAPVLSAPFEGAWRAAKGKAAVGLSGDLWKLFAFRNQDGQEYWAIRYDVSQRTQRIGFVKRSALENAAQPWEETSMRTNVSVTVIQETCFTDDPDVSQFAQVKLPVGSILNCMGVYNDDYAYVSAEVRDGRLVDGGQIIWGFVPLRDIQTAHSFGAVSDTALMHQLAGHWEFAAGGLSVGDYVTLHEDGTFETYMFADDDFDSYLPDRTGSWSITPYSPGLGLYWDDPEYEITFLFDDGGARVHGLTPHEDGNGFSITFWEGGGGYMRIEQLPHSSEPNG